MKILITGGTGVIGRAFIRQFNDYQYTLLTRYESKARSIFAGSVEVITGLDHFYNLNEYDAVINLAGEAIVDKRWTDMQKRIICHSRWQITQTLVDLISRSDNPPKVFLSGSAIGIYGNREDEILTEAFPVTEMDFPTQLCIEWEKVAAHAKPYTRVVFLRTGVVLSLDGGALKKMLLPFKLFMGGRLGSGLQFMSWIHIQDYNNAVNYLLTNKEMKGPVNLVAPEPARNKAFTQGLAVALNRKALFIIPKPLLKLMLGESSCLLLDSQKVVPEKLLNSGFEFSFPKLTSALDSLLGRESS